MDYEYVSVNLGREDTIFILVDSDMGTSGFILVETTQKSTL